MTTCITAIGWEVKPMPRNLKNGILQIKAMHKDGVISLVINDSLKVEILKPCIQVNGGLSRPSRSAPRLSSIHSSLRRKDSLRNVTKSQKNRHKSVRSRGGTRKSRGDKKGMVLTVLLRLLGFYFFVLLADEIAAPTIRTRNRESNVLTLQQFLTEDVLKYAPNIKAIELTGNVTPPELIQILEHTGRMQPALQPMSLPPSLISHPTFIEAKFPEGSATAQLALAQVAMPFISRNLIIYGDSEATRHRFYRWWLNWEVIHRPGTEITVSVTLDKTQYSGDTRYRSGINSSKILTELVLKTAEEQIQTMVQTGMIRKFEYKGLASLLMGNFNPKWGFLPESMQMSSGYHRDTVYHDHPGLIKSYGASRSVPSYEDRWGATQLNKLPNATMVRSRRFDQILSFTYEKGVPETEIAAYLEDDRGATNFAVIDSVGKGKSHTYMIDQMTGVQHKARYPTVSSDRRAILLSVEPMHDDVSTNHA